MISRISLIFLLFIVVFMGCKGPEEKADPKSVYLDYQITGSEGNPDVTILIQFRRGGPYAATFQLSGSEKITLDGSPLKADSSKYTGYFYEVQVPVKGFTGEHSIVYTAADGNQFGHNFRYRPFSLQGELPTSFKRGNLVVTIEGLENQDKLRVLLSDTSIKNDGIERVDTIKSGKLEISAKDLDKLADGPVNMELIRENEQKLRKDGMLMGRLYTSYGLRREFLLYR